MKNKWIWLAVALMLMTMNILNGDFSVYRKLSLADLLPVIVITLVSVLIKTGVLSAILIGIKQLIRWLRRK